MARKKLSFIPRALLGLSPKEEKFFTMFKAMTINILEGANLLKEMLDNFDNFDNRIEYQHKIKDVEHKGDTQTHEIIKLLNKSFITPFDREDIYSLASKMDDILDLIDNSAAHIVMYKVTAPTPEMRELAFIILKTCQAIDKAISLLGGDIDKIAELCVEVNSLENEADIVCRNAVSGLFANEKDPITLIKLKEIYETLEKAIDKCEDVANILESVVLKHA